MWYEKLIILAIYDLEELDKNSPLINIVHIDVIP